MKVLFSSVYYQTVASLRVKQAVFFSLVFPAFMFITFGKIWGNDDPNYIRFLLSGIIGITVASDGLFAVGTVIKHYYQGGLIKYLNKMPFNILTYFSGYIISRFIFIFFVIALLSISAFLIFEYSVTYKEFMWFVLGSVIGMFIFSFIGLSLSFSGIRDGFDTGLINFVYFIFIFTSNAFYPVEEFNEAIGEIGNMLPINPVLDVLRGGDFSLKLILWVTLPAILFYILFKRFKHSR